VTQRPAHVLYIAGSGRSGSTLVERSLGAIPGWVNVGELIELFRKPSVAEELCGCGEPFAACPFWGEVGSRVFGSWTSDAIARVGALQRQVSRQRFLPRLLLTADDSGSEFADALREYGAVYDSLYAAVADVADADVVVDASKWPGQALALKRAVTPELSLLHLVRDPRGVAYSWAKTQVRRPHGGDADSVMATHASTETARRWAAFQSEIALIRRAFDHSTRLRYEDFVNDPRGRLATTLRELGLGDYADRLGHVHRDRIDLPQSHGVAGNPSRFDHGVVAVRADEAWRSAFPEKDRRRVTAITAPWLARYGYPLRTEPQSAAATTAAAAETDVADWPTVCVILPTRGRPELVREAVESVIDQDYAGDIDVIVVHDQEEPQTELKALERKGRSITLLNNTHAQGLAGARNTGLDHTDAAFIASCDDDDFWDEDKLRLQMTRMLAEPDLNVLGAGIRLLMGEDHVVEWPGDSPDISRAQLLRSRRKELHSSTLLMRREVFDQVGGYDETLPMSYAEDYEFLLRAVETGRVGVVNTPLASIRKYNASWFRERAEVVAEALEYLLRTHPQIAESRAGHARVLGQIAFARSTMGQRREALSIAGHAFRRWPVAPHAALAVIHAATGIDPRVLLASTRKAGRGIT
jgi:GT2 family glycosyltransferase